jgi:hypothetical protein
MTQRGCMSQAVTAPGGTPTKPHNPNAHKP